MNLALLIQKMFRPYAERSFAAMRIDFYIGRTFSIALLGIAAQMSVNAFAQYEHLDKLWFWVTWVSTVGSIIGLFIHHWVYQGGRQFYLLHVLATVLTISTWSLQYHEPGAFDDRPWIWSTLGMAALSAGLGLNSKIAWPIITLLPLWWVSLRTSPMGGGETLMVASQDAIYTFLFSATFVSLIELLRTRAREADIASVKASEAISEQARIDAAERERMRVDAMVHEKLLATLSLAANAEKSEEQKVAHRAATEALQELRDFEHAEAVDQTPVAVNSLFLSIEKIIETHYPKTVLTTNGSGTLSISSDAASAFTEATMEALKNSFQFAGPNSKQQVILKCQEKSFKIVIKDDGRGFRPSRVPRNRLGIRLVIRGQVEAVGGEVKIDSRPGEGCNVVLEWSVDK